MAGFDNQGLDHVALAVADVERSQRFYAEVLGLERAHEAWDVPVVMAAEGTGVALFPKDFHPGSDAGGEPPAIRVLHLAFRLGRAGFDAVREHLAERGVDARFADHGISHSVYLRDPDDHQIELTTYDV